jgi:hypothetical protein
MAIQRTIAMYPSRGSTYSKLQLGLTWFRTIMHVGQQHIAPDKKPPILRQLAHEQVRRVFTIKEASTPSTPIQVK